MGLRFVLADDDEDDREIFREALLEADKNVQLTTFDNALSLLKSIESTQAPDLIFLDINLPQVSGWECLRKIKSSGNSSAIPVVMYSTSSYQRDVQVANELGAIGLITKPSDFELLKQMLKEIASAINSENSIDRVDFIKKPDHAA